ncbi:hypothetical protein LPV64_22260, partial [Ralstonia pseudosolanacearum]|nr:hypothetical protein [Ralstonia pseudosolanacearum]
LPSEPLALAVTQKAAPLEFKLIATPNPPLMLLDTPLQIGVVKVLRTLVTTGYSTLRCTDSPSLGKR